MPDESRRHRLLIGLIILGVVAWGIFHAIGAYRLNDNPWRAVVVMACVGGFLGLWGLLLRQRARQRR
jgi:hypothetical protein